MFNVCPHCGEYAVEKTIDPSGPFAVCPFCQHAHPFLQQPLFLITGPSGAGKTTVCLELASRMNDCVIMETDILWGVIPATPEDNCRDYRNTWLRIAKNVGQAGRPVVLCGTAIPEQVETCPERRYFSESHYLALVCDEALLEERLKLRLSWHGSGSSEFVEKMLRFNQWIKEHTKTTNPPMTLSDTTHRSIQEVAQWIRERLEGDARDRRGVPNE